MSTYTLSERHDNGMKTINVGPDFLHGSEITGFCTTYCIKIPCLIVKHLHTEISYTLYLYQLTTGDN